MPSNTSKHTILLADAFANNLVETGIGCMMELATDEVIMNEEVKPPEESDFPRMHLAVLDENDKPIESATYKYDPTVTKIKIAFVNPYTTSEFNEDLQYVIDVEGPTEDSRAAEFVAGGSVGCDNNKRVAGRLLTSQSAVELQINDPTAKLKLWAGWATGHNAVRLVPDLILEPQEAGSPAEKKDEGLSIEEQEEAIQELEEEIGEAEFRNTDKEKVQREKEEEKLEKLLADSPDVKTDGEHVSSETIEEEIEELEEEIGEEEFRNTDKEKEMREKEEEKLDKLLNEEPKQALQEKERALSGETKETSNEKPGSHRKRKNLLQTEGNVPEGLLNPSKSGKDLGLEIARKNRERGQQRDNVSGETKSIQQKLKDKQYDLDASNDKSDKKKRHKLSDHTAKKRRDIPEKIDLHDDVNDDDLPEPYIMNDDSLPLEEEEGSDEDPEVNGNQHVNSAGIRGASRRGNELKVSLDSSRHLVACAFFATSMGLFMVVYGKKRDKGRRDL